MRARVIGSFADFFEIGETEKLKAPEPVFGL
jgi:hypothetical protein